MLIATSHSRTTSIPSRASASCRHSWPSWNTQGNDNTKDPQTLKAMKRPVVVSSLEDIAGQNIKSRLVQMEAWVPRKHDSGAKEILFSDRLNAYLLTIEEGLVRSDRLDEYCKQA